MDRPPRPVKQGIMRGSTLIRAWGFLGAISAVLVMGGCLLVLHRAGWHPGVATGPGSPLHHAYQQATTVAWLGIVACQIGTAFAARTEHASLRAIGLFSNPALLAGIAAEIAFALLLVYAPFLHSIFGTAALSAASSRWWHRSHSWCGGRMNSVGCGVGVACPDLRRGPAA